MNQWEKAEAEADMIPRDGIGALGVVVILAVAIVFLGISYLIISAIFGGSVVVTR